MSDHHEPEQRQDDDLLENLGYETRDTEIEHAPMAVAWYFAFAGLCLVLTWLWIKFTADQGTLDRPVIENRRIPEEPNPLLQSNRTARTDLIELRRQERMKTEFYTRDPETGVIRVPIERALELELQDAQRLAEQQVAIDLPIEEEPSDPADQAQGAVPASEQPGEDQPQ